MSEMVERVARALCRKAGENPDEDKFAFLGGTPIGKIWQDYEDDARAAIEAMREPTPEMVKQGEANCFEWMSEDGHEWTHDAFKDGYVAAIDAALGKLYA